MITTKDITIKDQEPKKLTIISTGDVKPKDFVIKGKGKPQSKQVITTSNVEDKKTPLNADQEKIIADIKKEQARVKEEQKKTKKLEADLKKANAKLKAITEKEDKKKLIIDKKGKTNKGFTKGDAAYQKELEVKKKT